MARNRKIRQILILLKYQLIDILQVEQQLTIVAQNASQKSEGKKDEGDKKGRRQLMMHPHQYKLILHKRKAIQSTPSFKLDFLIKSKNT